MNDTSPVPIDAEIVHKLDFPNAVAAMIQGKKVTRQEWGEKNTYGLMKDGTLQIRMEKTGKFHIWQVSEADMVSDDWVIVSEAN